MIAARLRRFAADARANVATIFALALLPTIFLAGMALDYANAIQKQQSLNAAADSAVLAAVSPTLFQNTTAQAQAQAQAVFNGLASSVGGVSIASVNVQVTQNGLARSASLAYSAASTNFFPTILGQLTWGIGGQASANATMAPNIDFYLLLDNSPSMALAATSAGIQTMIANTSQQDNGLGCAFACHQSQPSSADTPGNPVGWDNYQLAQSLGVVSRIQTLARATQSLTSTAQKIAAAYGATFRMAVYDFNTPQAGAPLNTVAALTSSLSAAGAAAAGVDTLVVCKGNYLSCSTYDDSTDTDFASAFSALNAALPTPGDGAAGNRPQEVVFLMTDGVEDKQATSCAYPLLQTSGFARCIQPFDISTCATIKSRGVKIAVLYTEYLPMPNEAFYTQTVANFQSAIGPNLQNCASPGLFLSVSANGDIPSAMSNLFNAIVQSAEPHLSQ